MFQAKPYSRSRTEASDIKALYRRAFPANEQCALQDLLENGRWETQRILVFYDGGRFCGFASLLTAGDITQILYLAIDEALQGQGRGSRALAAIHSACPGQRVTADLEVLSPQAPNYHQRQRRRAFYLRNGYTVSEATDSWRGERYEILVHGGELTQEDFDGFWDAVGVTDD